jgi:hypothetical protein
MGKYNYSSIVEYKGKSLTVKQIALQHRMVPETLIYRLNKGLTIKKALKTPIQIQKRLPKDKMTPERLAALRALEGG